MTNHQTLLFAVGTIATFSLLILFGYVTIPAGSKEELINHAFVITFAAFLAIVGYEDWKDARRERLNKSH